MALTSAQKAEVRRWLGYPDWSVALVTTQWWIEGNFDELSAEAVAVVVSLLARMTAIWDQVATIRTRAGIKRVEDIEFFGAGDGINVLGIEANEVVDQIAYTLDAIVRAYPFKGARYGSGIARRGA